MNCNGCKKPCAAKNGDWFFAKGGNQVFLCKLCESGAAKGDFTRVSLAGARKL